MKLEAGASGTEADMLELGELLRHHVVLHPDDMDSGGNIGDDEGTDPGEREEDRR